MVEDSSRSPVPVTKPCPPQETSTCSGCTDLPKIVAETVARHCPYSRGILPLVKLRSFLKFQQAVLHNLPPVLYNLCILTVEATSAVAVALTASIHIMLRIFLPTTRLSLSCPTTLRSLIPQSGDDILQLVLYPFWRKLPRNKQPQISSYERPPRRFRRPLKTLPWQCPCAGVDACH